MVTEMLHGVFSGNLQDRIWVWNFYREFLQEFEEGVNIEIGVNKHKITNVKF